MRRLLHLPLAAVTSLVLALLLAPPAQARVLKIATLAPDGTAWMQEMRAGAGEIERRTAGRVRLKFYPGGVMGNDKSVLRKIRIRQLQGGALTSGSLAEVYPDLNIYNLPFLFRSQEEVDYVRAQMDAELRRGLERAGFVTLGITQGGFAYLMSDKPVSSIDDLAGQKIWIPEGDRIAQTIFEAAGISPVSLPLSDVYTGLQTGLVDTVVTTPTAAIALQWHTRLSHLTDQPLVFVFGLLVVDKASFEALSPQDRQVVREVIGEVFERLDETNQREDLQAREALKAQGIEFIRPNPQEVARWREIAERAIRTLGEQGVYTPAMLQAVRERLQAYRQAHAGTP